ncbi:sensor histidine kinase [Ramlibacter sp. MAHUQ-53]|uniref:sensor histidine kinase n=1 Tax=unclassified Ramlibacter TaxID=2617605 RepID=UPI003626C305
MPASPWIHWLHWRIRLRAFASGLLMHLLREPLLHPSPRRIQALGLSTALGHPLFHLVWTRWLPQPYDNPWERLAAGGLGLFLLLAPGLRQQPPSREAAWVFCAVTWLSLPVYFTWMYLCNDRNTVWLTTLAMVILIYFHLSDWRIASVGLVGGLPAGWLLFAAAGPAVQPVASEEATTHGVLLAFAGYMGLILGLSAYNLRRAQLEQALGTMGIMAHELRTPLATIALVGDAVRLQSQASAPDAARLGELAERLGGMVRRMNCQIDMQITNARMMNLRPRHDPVPVAAVVRARVEGYPFRSEGERACVQVHVIRDFAFPGAPDLFGQVIDNLVKNALRSLASLPQPPGPGDLRIVVEKCRAHGRVAVIDRGAGMDPLLRARLFQPFVSTHQGSGHGLGLAFCQRVVRASRGQIRVESEPGQGARFLIELPLVAGRDA